MILTVLLLLAFLSLCAALGRAVRLDGLGTRPGPRSHHDTLPRHPQF